MHLEKIFFHYSSNPSHFDFLKKMKQTIIKILRWILSFKEFTVKLTVFCEQSKMIRQYVSNSNNWGMHIPLSDYKHRFVRDNSKKHIGNPRKKFSLRQNLRIFFPTTFLFWWKFFPDKKKIFAGKKTLGFCLGLNFVSDWICLGLNFVSDYIMQLYFVCNRFII